MSKGLYKINLRILCHLCMVFLFIFISLNTSYAEMVLFDDFEYWTSPYNNGWHTTDPSYPVYGYGIGYGTIRTVLDLLEGSRVLEVLYRPSVLNRLQPYTVFNFDLYDAKKGKFTDKKVISFKIWSELAIEPFELFQFAVYIKTKSNKTFRLMYSPIEGPSPALTDDQIVVNIGRGYQDGTWHTVVRNLDTDLKKALPNEEFSEVTGIAITGFHFKVDDIKFYDDLKFLNNRPPELYRIGPQFATIFSEYFLLIAARDPDGDFLQFNATIGGYGSNGAGPTNFLYRLQSDPNDPNSPPAPNVAALYFVPYTFDDLVITIKVTDGYLADIETFTLSVVNFPVWGIDHPPYLEQLDSAVGYVDTRLNIKIIARDIDPNDILTYTATIDGMQFYQYGPWQQSIIDPFTGVINFTPVFEGKHWIDVVVRDNRGMYASDGFELNIVNPGTWLNHPPVVTKKVQSPQVVRAGQEYHVPIDIIDPDGEKLYYTSNIGTVTERQDGIQGCVFTLLTNFPGQYLVKVTAYDIRGGNTDDTFLLDVQPWWSI